MAKHATLELDSLATNGCTRLEVEETILLVFEGYHDDDDDMQTKEVKRGRGMKQNKN